MKEEVTSTQEKQSTLIMIKPYVESDNVNMGLERYSLALFDNAFHEEQLGLIERNGLVYYLNGLNEFAPEVKNIQDDEVREAKIKDIRKTVAQLEKDIAFNVIDVNDKDFWAKVTICKPNNHDFWSKVSIRCSNQTIYLNPNDSQDLIKLKAIEAGGFTMIAKSFEEARTSVTPPRFYLDKFIESIAVRTEYKKLKNKAIAELDKLSNKNVTKLFYVAKVLDKNSIFYKKNTPNDVIYDNMDKFINGQGLEKIIKKAANDFIEACNMDMEELKIRAMIKDSIIYKIMATKSDGFIYHIATNTMMGRNTADCIEFLKNPLNDSILLAINEETEKNWGGK